MTEFERAISTLGTTPETIMAALRTKGIKGNRGSTCSCPIAKYLRACGFQFATAGMYLRRYNDGSGLCAEESILASDALRAWINGFDHRQYPEFDLSEWRD